MVVVSSLFLVNFVVFENQTICIILRRFFLKWAEKGGVIFEMLDEKKRKHENENEDREKLGEKERAREIVKESERLSGYRMRLCAMWSIVAHL